MLSIRPLEGVPPVGRGDDIGGLLAGFLPDGLEPGDVLVVAHKIISKAQGRIRLLDQIEPGQRARALAAELDKEPRHVQAILDEAAEVIRAERGVLICLTRQGFVCANAGVDASNVSQDGAVVLLPEDPDGSARALRSRLKELLGVAPGVVITDSFGRAWRHGQVDVAIGCAGLTPLDDWRGRHDTAGRPLKATWIAVADELAAAADLVRTKDSSQPAILVRGAKRFATSSDGPGAAAILRPRSEDLFR